MKTKKCPKCKGLGGYPKCGTCQNRLFVNEEADDRLPRTACSPSSDYVPFGPEWEAEALKNRKADLMNMLRRASEDRNDMLHLLRRIARKGEFMDREGLRLVVSDWLARRGLSLENTQDPA